MDICEIRRAAKLAEWKQRVCECRSSGQTVKSWCEEHHIASKTYYRWERLCVLQASGEAAQKGSANLVRIEPERLPADDPEPPLPEGIRLQHGATSIELPAGTAPEAVAALVAALNSHA